MSDTVVGNTLFQKSGFWFSLGTTCVLRGGGDESKTSLPEGTAIFLTQGL